MNSHESVHRGRVPVLFGILCPVCTTGRLALESIGARRIACRECNASFPIRDGIIDLLPESAGRSTLSQAVMEWQPFIEVFESKWFRTGPFFSFIAGISFQDEYKIILEAARLAGDEIMLDLGCGSGIYSRPLARELQHGAVIGLDLSMPMLHYASSRARALGLENLIFVHGNAHRLPFPDNQFAAANSTATIHLFSPAELRDTLKEIHRVLKPGGRLMASCLRNILPGEPAKRFYDWYSPKVGTYYRRPEDLELFFEEAGFTDINCHHARRYWQVMSATKRG